MDVDMPKEDEIHQCEFLKYQGRYLQFCCEGRGNARWRLIWAKTGEPSDCDEVFVQNVLYCPCCGKDMRAGVGTEPAGRPEEARLLKLGCRSY